MTRQLATHQWTHGSDPAEPVCHRDAPPRPQPGSERPATIGSRCCASALLRAKGIAASRLHRVEQAGCTYYDAVLK